MIEFYPFPKNVTEMDGRYFQEIREYKKKRKDEAAAQGAPTQSFTLLCSWVGITGISN